MNTQAKRKLEGTITNLTALQKTLLELEGLQAREAAAAKRHAKAGSGDYARHAFWSATGIQKAIDLACDWDLAEAAHILQAIVASSPTDSLPSWDAPTQPESRPSSVCSRGVCNHPEHL